MTIKNAYEAACHEAMDIARDTFAAWSEACKEAECELDSDEGRDLMNQEIDNALIYTNSHWVCAFGLLDNDDLGECGSKEFDKQLAWRAYGNLMAAVEDMA